MASTLAQPLLTIGIPTYNRAPFLDRALGFIWPQLKGGELPVEVIVSDNCSTDNTAEIVDKYIKKGMSIKYLKNAENKGADFNIAQCYINSAAKYVVAFGDDDVLLNGSIAYLMEILNLNIEVGVIYLSAAVYKSQEQVDYPNRRFTVYDDALDFLKRVNISTTFISGNVVNAKFINQEELYKGLNTSLIQVPLILESILQSKTNIYVENVMICSEPDNTGGYNLFKIFGRNFNAVIDKLAVSELKKSQIRRFINSNLLLHFFPVYILKFRKDEHKFVRSNPIHDLRETFRKDFLYWFIIVPVVRLPHKLATLYYSVARRIFSAVIL